MKNCPTSIYEGAECDRPVMVSGCDNRVVDTSLDQGDNCTHYRLSQVIKHVRREVYRMVAFHQQRSCRCRGQGETTDS